MVQPDINQAYNAQEAAKLLGICRQTLRIWIKKGLIHAVKLGPRRWLITQDEISRVLTEGTEKGD